MESCARSESSSTRPVVENVERGLLPPCHTQLTNPRTDIMAKIPTRKFSTTKSKIPSRKFAKGTTKIPARPRSTPKAHPIYAEGSPDLRRRLTRSTPKAHPIYAEGSMVQLMEPLHV